jgi:hypothetical protein
VGCSHAEGCPLFPFLRASLQGWRDYYCDSEDRWHDCARYKLARSGQLVPISLLPNGHDAWHLRREADESWSAAQQRQARGQVPVSWREPWQQESASWFEPAPPPAPPSIVAPRPRPRVHPQPSYQAGSDPYGRQISRRRGWWARLVDWMKGPV